MANGEWRTAPRCRSLHFAGCANIFQQSLMLEKHILTIAQELALDARQVAATAVLLEEGATVPFIARYRKERTGELDEVKITSLRDRLEQLEELDKRRESIV